MIPQAFGGIGSDPRWLQTSEKEAI